MSNMSRETRLVQFGKRVEKELGTQPISDPIAGAAAVASLYAQKKCTPQDALDYLDMLATAGARLNEAVDRDELLCRLGVSCGITLHTLHPKIASCFHDPRLANEKCPV